MSLQVAGIEVEAAIIAPLDPEFLPAALFTRKYRQIVSARGGVPLRLALEGGDGSVSTYSTSIIPPENGHLPATLLFVERIVKFLLWQRGGWRLSLGGPSRDWSAHQSGLFVSRSAQFRLRIYEHGV